MRILVAQPLESMEGRMQSRLESLMFGLTPLEQHCLIKCYHEGHTESQVAEWLGKSRKAIAMVIRRASDKLARQGLPRPRPYGRGSREELRSMFPMLADVI